MLKIQKTCAKIIEKNTTFRGSNDDFKKRFITIFSFYPGCFIFDNERNQSSSMVTIFDLGEINFCVSTNFFVFDFGHVIGFF